MSANSPSPSLLVAVAVLVAAFAAGAWRLASHSAVRDPARQTTNWIAMGTVAAFTSAGGADHAAWAETVRGAFEDVERRLSLFRADSDLSRLNASGFIDLPAAVAEGECDVAGVVAYALAVARDTDGAFDPTVNPLMRLWGFRKGVAVVEPPSDESMRKALAMVGWRHVALATNDDGRVTLRLDARGVELDLGGIAKGYAVDLACARLAKAGAGDFIVNLGGNIRVCGRPDAARETWRIAVRDPNDPSRTTGDIVELADGEAVATSGSYERFVEIGGRRYSHIIDPRTGRPVARGGSVSVVAPSAMEADAYSTALFVQGAGAADGRPVVVNRSRP